MSIIKYPSPAHERKSDAYWIAKLTTDDPNEAQAIILGQAERRILELDPVAGERILKLLKAVRAGLMSQMSYKCHDVAEHVFDEPGTFRELRLVYSRGEIIGPEQAARRFELPCGIQFHNSAMAHAPVFHSAVLLGMDQGVSPQLLPSERAIILHKPGTHELEIVTLAAATLRYADKLRDITYYGANE